MTTYIHEDGSQRPLIDDSPAERAARLAADHLGCIAILTTAQLQAKSDAWAAAGVLACVTDAGNKIHAYNSSLSSGGIAPTSGNGQWIVVGSGAGGSKVYARLRVTSIAAYTRTGNTIVADAVGAIGDQDSVAVAVGDRLFLDDQAAAAADKGVYVLTAAGAAGSKFSMTRAPEMDASVEVVPGMVVTVQEGTLYHDRSYVLTTDATITLNTTALSFTDLGTAALLTITDTHTKYTSTNVDGALDELATTTGGAIVGIADAGSYFVGVTVEAALQELGVDRIYTVSKSFDFNDVAALGGVVSGSIDFAAALPAGACVVGCDIDVTAIFDNAGDTASGTADIGISGGDTDIWVDGAALDAVAHLAAPLGVQPYGFVGAVTPSVLVTFDVNCDTITKGAAVATVKYRKLW